MRPAQAEVCDAGIATDANDVLAYLIEHPDGPIHGRPDYRRVDLRLRRELGNRPVAVIGEHDIEKAAQFDLAEARTRGLANDVDLPAYARGRDVVGGRRPHSRARRDECDDLRLASGDLEYLRT